MTPFTKGHNIPQTTQLFVGISLGKDGQGFHGSFLQPSITGIIGSQMYGRGYQRPRPPPVNYGFVQVWALDHFDRCIDADQ
jgi:hypothetical protein